MDNWSLYSTHSALVEREDNLAPIGSIGSIGSWIIYRCHLVEATSLCVYLDNRRGLPILYKEHTRQPVFTITRPSVISSRFAPGPPGANHQSL